VNKKIESIIKEEKTKKNADPEPEPEFLSPLFDMSDAPILDFSSFSSVSEDPSLLISKVQYQLQILHFVLFTAFADPRYFNSGSNTLLWVELLLFLAAISSPKTHMSVTNMILLDLTFHPVPFIPSNHPSILHFFSHSFPSLHSIPSSSLLQFHSLPFLEID
jgi:hypothetical protein